MKIRAFGGASEMRLLFLCPGFLERREARSADTAAVNLNRKNGAERTPDFVASIALIIGAGTTCTICSQRNTGLYVSTVAWPLKPITRTNGTAPADVPQWQTGENTVRSAPAACVDGLLWLSHQTMCSVQRRVVTGLSVIGSRTSVEDAAL